MSREFELFGGAALLLCGDSAVSIEFGNSVDPALNARVLSLQRSLTALHEPGIIESVPTYRSLCIYYDPLLLNFEQLRALLWPLLEQTAAAADLPRGRTVELPVLYGGAAGPDLGNVAAHCHLSKEEVIALHSAREYPVYMLGFLPGFPYLGDMDARLQTPRLATPRRRLPPGSVGIAGMQTGVYSLPSPGGWQIIGRTPVPLFSARLDPPALLRAGDSVRFVPVESGEFARLEKMYSDGRSPSRRKKAGTI